MSQGFWSEYTRAYRGAYGWTAWLVTVYGVAATAVLIWSLVRLLHAGNTHDEIVYASVLVISAVFVALVKIWFWLLLHRNAVMDRLDQIDAALKRR